MSKKFMEITNDNEGIIIHVNNYDLFKGELLELFGDEVDVDGLAFAAELVDLIKSGEINSYEDAIKHFKEVADFLLEKLKVYEFSEEELDGEDPEVLRAEAIEGYQLLFNVIDKMFDKEDATWKDEELGIGYIKFVED